MSKTIAIIGGGFSGSMIAVHQMLEIIKHQTITSLSGGTRQKINIKLYDRNGLAGPGEPYAERTGDEDIFLLNQPAFAMSPFPDQPDHFIDWLNERGDPHDNNSFMPRRVYGHYLKDVFSRAVRSYEHAGCGNINVIKGNVSEIAASADNYRITTDKRSDKADTVVIATGHNRSLLLAEHAEHPRYFSAPYDITRAHEKLEDANDPVLIIGTSQSMLDGLALLDHIGVKGPIYALSRHMVTPWLFDAEAESRVDKDYQYRYLTEELLSCPSAHSFESLKAAFDRELAEARNDRFPTGHILSRFNASALEACIQNPVTDRNFNKLACYISALYGNPTSPERYRLMSTYKEADRLQFITGDITQANIKPLEDGFSVKMNGQKPFKISAMFNSASYNMKAISDQGCIASPFLEKLDRSGALKRHPHDKHAFASGAQNWKNFYMAGPACSSQRWGVGTFRDSLAKIATQSINGLMHNR